MRAVLSLLLAVPLVGLDRPNVVLILADDMGYSDVGCFGGEIDTPHLDSLAANGLRFTQMYNTSKCFPSRGCLLTGRYAQEVGMARGPGKFSEGVQTIGHVLGAAGYRTFWSGKHHGTQNPVTLGFDHYYGLRDGACNFFNPGTRREGEPAPAQKRNNRAWCDEEETFTPGTFPEGFYVTDAFTARALEYLESTRDGEDPFFLYLAYTTPHDPMMAWPEDIAKYKGRYDEGWQAIRDARVARQREVLPGVTQKPSAPEFPDWSAWNEEKRAEEARRMEVYAAMVDSLDQNVGRVLRKLDDLGVRENTLILFVSDNGGSSEVVRIGQGEIGSMTRWSSVEGRWANVSNTPLRKYKNYSHEGGISSPCVVSWPKGIQDHGAIRRTPVHFIDLLPTFAHLGGAECEATGESFAPLLRSKDWTREKPLFWQWGRGKAVRVGEWKAVRWKDEPWQLFDLSEDRIEETDLAAEHPERLARLVALFEEWKSSHGG